MKRISPREASELMDEGVPYLDVRTPEEFASGHPRGAYNVPWSFIRPEGSVENPDFVREVLQLVAPDQRVVVGCKSGVRSLKAASALEAAGFTALFEQRAGCDGVTDPFGRVKERGWRAEGLAWALTPEPGRSHAEIVARAR